MVATVYINNVVKALEKFLLSYNNFELNGETYKLMFFDDSDFVLNNKYSLVLSAKLFDELSQKEIVTSSFKWLMANLTLDEYNSIARINVLKTKDPFVNNINVVFGFREPIFEITDYYIGMVSIQHGYFAKSLVLDKLVPNKVIAVQLDNGLQEQILVKRIDRDYNVFYYTSHGMMRLDLIPTDEMADTVAKSSHLEESDLIRRGFMNKVNFTKIRRVF